MKVSFTSSDMRENASLNELLLAKSTVGGFQWATP